MDKKPWCPLINAQCIEVACMMWITGPEPRQSDQGETGALRPLPTCAIRLTGLAALGLPRPADSKDPVWYR